MSSRNKGFAADLAGAIDARSDVLEKPSRATMGVLAGRGNRLSELAAGAVVSSTLELVDPARCRMWAGHNREYASLSAERCQDLIESMKAQGKQEMPAIVRRVSGTDDYDFEVICGARRHWSVSWLRSHNYPDFRFLIDIRRLTDEEAFRLGDLENRARDDISDLERSRDYLRALDLHYDGHQKTMAERINVSVSWLSRYLDLARLPLELMPAFADPHDLGIKHVTLLKPLLKPDDKRRRVFAEAARIAEARNAGEPGPRSVPDVIRALTNASPPKKTGSPKKTGMAGEVVESAAGTPVLRVDRRDRKSISLTLLCRGGGTREDAELAIGRILDEHWR